MRVIVPEAGRERLRIFGPSAAPPKSAEGPRPHISVTHMCPLQQREVAHSQTPEAAGSRPLQRPATLCKPRTGHQDHRHSRTARHPVEPSPSHSPKGASKQASAHVLGGGGSNNQWGVAWRCYNNLEDRFPPPRS